MIKIINILIGTILLTNIFALLSPTQAQDNEVHFQAIVVKELGREEINDGEQQGTVQQLKVRFLEGEYKDSEMEVEHINLNDLRKVTYAIGDVVYVAKVTQVVEDQTNFYFYIVDQVRYPAIYILFALFLFLAIVIGGRRGFFAILGLAISFALLIWFTLPSLLSGMNPVFVVSISALVIVFLNFYLAHGFNLKTSVAVAGTLIAILITSLLAVYFVNLTNLYGFASEEAVFLAVQRGDVINIQVLLIIGIIIGTIGVLDDITISQASIAYELKSAAKELNLWQLYHRTMSVGKDHIASLVNTLVLVYASSALPLLLLFVNSNSSFEQSLNYEIVAEPVVATLISSIGLIIAVPLTTLMAAYVFTKWNIKFSKETSKPAHTGHIH